MRLRCLCDFLRLSACLATLLPAASSANATKPEPKIELLTTQVTLDAPTGADTFDLALRGTDLAGNNVHPTLAMVGASGPAGLRVGEPEIEPSSANLPQAKLRLWNAKIKVSGLPMTGKVERQVVVSYPVAGGVPIQSQATLTLANKPYDGLKWSLIPPPKQVFLGTRWPKEGASKEPVGAGVSFGVKNGPRPLDELKIVGSSLQDEKTLRTLGAGWLSLEGLQDPVVPFGTEAVRLAIDPQFKEAGSFKGNVLLAVDGGDEPQKLELIVYSRRNVVLGTALIAAGSVLSWVLGVAFVRYRSRLRAREGLEAIDEGLDGLEKVLGMTGVGDHVSNLADRLQEVRGDLDQSKEPTRSLLPPGIFEIGTYDSQPLRQHLETMASRAEILAVLIGEGIRQIAREWNSSSEDSRREAVRKLDGLLPTSDWRAMKVEQAHVEVAGALALLRPSGAAGAQRTTRAAREPLSLTEIQIRLNTLDGLRWGFWLALSVTVGFVALILENAGFGTVRDLTHCFLWGLGVQSAGAGFEGLTRDSFSKLVGVKVPVAA